MRKRILALMGLVVLSISLATPNSALAADFRVSKNGTETIKSDESVKNLYVAGNTINSDANVVGDLVAAGSDITVKGSVSGSAVIFGSNVTINSNISNNVKTAGATLDIDGVIGGDLFAAGSSINIAGSSKIAGDLAAAGNTLTIDGTINGNAWLAGNDVTINGKITGNVVAKDVTNLHLGDKASIGGNLTYYSKNNADISSKAVVTGNLAKNAPSYNSNNSWVGSGSTGGSVFVMTLFSFILLLAIIYLFPKSTKKFAQESLSDKFWSKMGTGFVLLIVTPIAAILMMLTFIGIPLGFATFAIYFGVIGLAKILSTITAGVLILSWLSKDKDRLDWLTALVGALVMAVLVVIPYIGWILPFGLFLIAVGQLWEYIITFARKER